MLFYKLANLELAAVYSVMTFSLTAGGLICQNPRVVFQVLLFAGIELHLPN